MNSSNSEAMNTLISSLFLQIRLPFYSAVWERIYIKDSCHMAKDYSSVTLNSMANFISYYFLFREEYQIKYIKHLKYEMLPERLKDI